MHPDRRPWTQQELDTLDKLLGKVSAARMGKRLKRTETPVVMKASQKYLKFIVSQKPSERKANTVCNELHRSTG